jgi:hypothetical protein
VPLLETISRGAQLLGIAYGYKQALRILMSVAVKGTGEVRVIH